MYRCEKKKIKGRKKNTYFTSFPDKFINKYTKRSDILDKVRIESFYAFFSYWLIEEGKTNFFFFFESISDKFAFITNILCLLVKYEKQQSSVLFRFLNDTSVKKKIDFLNRIFNNSQ